MFLHNVRYSTQPESTLGALSVDGAFECFLLEDTKRVVKVEGQTRLDDGLYVLALRVGSPMAKRYRAKYAWHQHGMIWIQGTPRHKYCYIHPGNTAENTEGCPLTGQSATFSETGRQRVGASVAAYKRLYLHVAPRIKVELVQLRVSNLW